MIVFKIEGHFIFFMALNVLQCTSMYVNTMLICISLSLHRAIFLQADFSKTNSKFHMNTILEQTATNDHLWPQSDLHKLQQLNSKRV